MPGLLKLAWWEGFLLLGSLAGIVVFKLIGGQISTRELLTGERAHGPEFFSPGRAQLLVVTVLGAAYDLVQVLHSPGRDSLPPLPKTMVAALGGSQAIYLAGKAWAVLGDRLGARFANFRQRR